jgi:hypothetical protein
MVAITGSLYLVSTLLFAVAALVIGIRLIALSRRTGQVPERLLGIGLQLTGFWGYGVMIFSILARSAMGASEHPLGVAITGLGWVAHDAGVICMLLFIRRVFRPEAAWAALLAGAFAVLLVVGFVGYAATGGLVTAIPNVWYWVGFGAIGVYPFWMSLESTLYWLRMRKRLALGLAEPLVVDRFRVWAMASACAAGAIWVVNIPTWLGVSPAEPEAAAVTTVSLFVTACFGLSTVGMYWVAFFPPGWYRRRLEKLAERRRAAA